MCMAAAATPTSAPVAPASGFQIVGFIQQYGGYLASGVNAALSSADNTIILIAKSAFVFLIILGVLLYYSRLGKRLGKELLEGGVVIGIFLFFGVPYLQNAFC